MSTKKRDPSAREEADLEVGELSPDELDLVAGGCCGEEPPPPPPPKPTKAKKENQAN